MEYHQKSEDSIAKIKTSLQGYQLCKIPGDDENLLVWQVIKRLQPQNPPVPDEDMVSKYWILERKSCANFIIWAQKTSLL